MFYCNYCIVVLHLLRNKVIYYVNNKHLSEVYMSSEANLLVITLAASVWYLYVESVLPSVRLFHLFSNVNRARRTYST